ncbi:MAG: glycosyltransferase family 2 protein [Candidatus Binatia bacterium]
MGDGDGLTALQGWSLPRDVAGAPVRWMGLGEAHLPLDVPSGATHVGVEVWAPLELIGRRPRLRLAVHDPFVDGRDEAARALDVCFRLRPGRWQTLECPIRPYGLGDSTRVILRLRLALDGPAWLQRRWPPRLALRAAWLRGPRIAAADVTIVVLNWQRPDDTIACLESLRAADLGGARVLVVDNGSRDDSAVRIQARFPEQPILALPENRGYAGGNNAGIHAALAGGAGAVLLLNNDAVVARDFLDPLIWVLNSHPRVAAVSSATLRPDGETLELAWLRVHFGHGLVRRVGMHALPSEGYNNPREVPVVVGCSVLMAADALRAVGPLDADYFAYHEDVDWCFRVRAAGWEVHYQPLSRVYHAGSRSTAALVRPLGTARNTGRPRLPNARELSWNPVRSYLGARNTIRFLRRHARWWHWVYFVAATAYHIPLELFAIAMDYEEEYLIGDWSYGIGLAYLLFGPRETRTAAAVARGLVTAPWRLLVTLPRALLERHRDGRTAELREHCRGLWDGLWNRPPDLHRLGLR